ncbi:MAG TPA: 3-phosphoshikimate 1-carboxyvinyltransferase [Puia sp.]|nr:3-phosphoshikimate 1-carboxyvinyltransferase [Puia sp.]
MLTTITPSVIKGAVQAPASKSSMQRACAAALLCGEETIVRNPGHSNDDRAALGVIQGLGATVKNSEDGSLRIIPAAAGTGMNAAASVPGQGRFQAPANVINCGESGLGFRMFAPIIAMSSQPVTVTGEGSLLTRPMDFFDEIFPQLGVQIVSDKGRLPLQIKGPLKPHDIEIDGSLSSQFLTGLLFAFAASGVDGVSIRVNNLKSRPYIDLTLQVLLHFGWEVENKGHRYEEFYFGGSTARKPGNALRSEAPHQAGTLLSYTVEGDWSGGAFLLVAGAIAGKIKIRGLDIHSTQADKAVLQALKDCGAHVSVGGENEIEIGPGKTGLRAFEFDATDCPDLFPPLVALASFCEGTTVIKGVSRLAHKESNRGLTLQEEFGKMGVVIGLDGDRMLIIGGRKVNGVAVHSRHDHRIAMACAVAALRAENETVIAEAQAIDKSYPDFYEHLRLLGAGVKITSI